MRRTRREKRILHPDADEFYQYVLGQRFDPGAQAEIFEPQFSNPAFLFRGAGRLAGSLNVLAGPQIYVNLSVPTTGIAGTIAGQLISAPLQVPPGETGS